MLKWIDLLCQTILDLHQKLITFSLARSLISFYQTSVKFVRFFKDKLIISEQTNNKTLKVQLKLLFCSDFFKEALNKRLIWANKCFCRACLLFSLSTSRLLLHHLLFSLLPLFSFSTFLITNLDLYIFIYLFIFYYYTSVVLPAPRLSVGLLVLSSLLSVW